MTKLQLAKKLYNQQLKRIKNFIKRAESRGYRFSKEKIIPKKPQRITIASVNKLKKITPDKLYAKSTYLSDSGKVVSGTQGRKEERHLSAVKSAETRKRNKQASITFGSWEDWRRTQDINAFENIKENPADYSEGEIVYNQIIDDIESVERYHKKAGEHLKKVLDAEITKYGRERVMRQIASVPEEAREYAEVAIRYNPGDSRHDDAVRELMLIITGEIPTLDEAQELDDLISEDAYTDYGEE